MPFDVNDKTTVVVRNVKKNYFVGSRGSKYSITGGKKHQRVHALRGVSFLAKAGESIGVIGHNGAGKSTLFRLISGAEAPTAGEIYVSSTPTLLGVSSALQDTLSGRDNIRLGLLAMGVKKQEVFPIATDIMSFADISDAIDRPMRTYSSGMRARLVFAISTAVRREILLVDEALSTGDKSFEARAKQRMDSFISNAGTVFVVSHGAGTIKEYCRRALWVHNGEIISDGSAEETTKAYVRWSKMRSRGQKERASNYLEDVRRAYCPPEILFDDEAARFLENDATSDFKIENF